MICEKPGPNKNRISLCTLVWCHWVLEGQVEQCKWEYDCFIGYWPLPRKHWHGWCLGFGRCSAIVNCFSICWIWPFVSSFSILLGGCWGGFGWPRYWLWHKKGQTTPVRRMIEFTPRGVFPMQACGTARGSGTHAELPHIYTNCETHTRSLVHVWKLILWPASPVALLICWSSINCHHGSRSAQGPLAASCCKQVPKRSRFGWSNAISHRPVAFHECQISPFLRAVFVFLMYVLILTANYGEPKSSRNAWLYFEYCNRSFNACLVCRRPAFATSSRKPSVHLDRYDDYVRKAGHDCWGDVLRCFDFEVKFRI